MATQLQTGSRPPIVIVGGGLAGLTLSIGLARNKIPHEIYESAKAFSEIGAGIALGPNSIRALEHIDPRITDCFMKCVTYNVGVQTDNHGNATGGRSDEWMDVRVGMKDR
jgi:salicylate hydroxylase